MSAETPGESTNEPPSWWRSGLNFIEAVARYVSAGCPNVTEAQYRERMEICAHCPLCRNANCLLCGCSLESKAKMATERCPRDPPFWSEIT